MERKSKRTSRDSGAAVTTAEAPLVQDELNGDIERELGPRISLIRRGAGLTLEQLAARTGFTKGYLSRIENSKVIPPIGTLVRLANVLGVGVADLFDARVPAILADRVSFVKRHEQRGILRGGSSFGYDYFALASRRNSKHMTPFIMIFPEKLDKDVKFDHEGEEFVYLLEGRVEFRLVVDGRAQSFVLEPGDSLYFDSTLPHSGRSLQGESKAIVVVAENASSQG